MNTFRFIYKFFIFIILFISYFLLTLPLLFIFQLFPSKARMILCRVVSFFAKILVKSFSIKIIIPSEIDNNFKGLIVSNHMSYIDILVISSLFPTLFVTSKELQRMPFLGLLASLGGCIFIDRINKRDRDKELFELTRELKAGNNIVIFPEATSTNGDEVKLFRKGLFPSVINANKPVLPLTINYTMVNNKRIDKENRDLLCWYDEMTFFKHFFNFLGLKSVVIEVKLSSALENTVNYHSIELANTAHAIVSSNFESLL